MSPGRLDAVCVVHEILPDPGENPPTTAIDKRPVPGRLDVGPLGLAADVQCDPKHHGGPDKALYAYAAEEAAWWAGHLGRAVPAGLFGENLRTAGLDVDGAEIGEQWRIGDGDQAVVVEVTMPRTPCVTFQRRMQEPRWVRRFSERGRPGAYLKVVRPGTVAAGDAVQVVTTPGHGVRIRDVFPRPTGAVMVPLLEAAAAGVVDLSPVMEAVARKVVDRERGVRRA